MNKFLGPTSDISSVIFIRLAVGMISLTQQILKYIEPNMGVLRFTRIGFPTLRPILQGRSRSLGLSGCDRFVHNVREHAAADRNLTAIKTSKISDLSAQILWFHSKRREHRFGITPEPAFPNQVGGGQGLSMPVLV